MEFKRVTPESVGIHSKGVLDFLEDVERRGVEMHGMMLLRHGKVCAEGWWKPYNPDSPHMMYSFTKSLTSTAIGFARQEGKIALEEKLCDIFPDKMPEGPSENLLACTVRDLLTMSCGHASEPQMIDLEHPDWIAAFLAHEFKYKPGTAFLYNTAGTNMLCAILRRRTGQNLTEYLKPRLFEPLGMRDVECFKLPDGTEMGGAGSRLCTEDMARFIQFVANKGAWEGRQLLEASWFDLAASKQVGNVSEVYDSASPDWRCGYGFQFWRCVPEHVFRADGAFGQYGVVFEEKDAVLILQSAAVNQQEQLTAAWAHILPAITDEETLPESPWAHVLRHTLESAETKTLLSTRNADSEKKYGGTLFRPETALPGLGDFIGGIWIVPPMGGKMQSLSLRFENDKAVLVCEEDRGTQMLDIGMNSHFALSTLHGRTYGAVGRWRGADRLEIEVRPAEAAGGKRWLWNFTENGLVIESEPTLPVSGGLVRGGYERFAFTR